MSDMVELVARAVEQRMAEKPIQTLPRPEWFREIARASIAAMREPTGEMMEALGWARAEKEGDLTHENVWHILIDAALQENGHES